jgi:uncharacterized membrane-anchored protein YjiN (DUF445 family)
MRIRVKEVREWMKTLDENKWRKTYNVDASRVAHFAKNMMEGSKLVLPTSLQRKVEGYEYKREKKMAKEYVRVLKRRLKEQKKENTLDESMKNKVRTMIQETLKESAKDKIRDMIREILKEETEYQKFFKKTLEKFNVKSPAELDDSKKKEFFNYIDKNFNSKNEKGKDGVKK